MSDGGGWIRPAAAIVAAVAALRLAGLAFDRTDLFVDEAQYWLWGQNLDLGYYSKPPLIAWVIRLSTGLAGSDTAFWIRMPGAILHSATALILAALAARAWGGRAAVWTAALYVTLPFTAVGSALISTDTVMAPFFAAALYAFLRLTETRAARFAALAGLAVGLAFLAKYAALYFLIGVAVAALFWREARVGWRNLLILAACVVLVATPNLYWNLAHGLSTVEHTLDNVGWVRGAGPGLNPRALADFAAAQFAVFGPVTTAALLWALALRPAGPARWLPAFVLPVLLVVCAQALLDRAYANWAVSAYFGGTLLVVRHLSGRRRPLLWLALATNALLSAAVVVVTVVNPARPGSDTPLLARYLGRAELSRQAIAAARQAGVTTIVADDRDVIADLFHTGRDAGMVFRAIPPRGRPQNYYQQAFALPRDATGPLLAILSAAPDCGGGPARPLRVFDTRGGAYARRPLAAYLIEADCARTLP